MENSETTLVLDSSIAVEPPKIDNPSTAPKVNLTPDKLLGMLSQMVKDGHIDTHQAADMRRKFGIPSGYFTKKKVDLDKKKRKKAISKASRRYNRSK
jgi:hypothetical protein